MLLFSTLVRSLKQKTRILLHYYCGITDNRSLPGYVYRNSTFKIELLQHLDCVDSICDRMIKATLHTNDNGYVKTLVMKVRQLLLNCLNLIIGSQLGKCLQQPDLSDTALDHVLHVCITSFHVSTHVARHGGLSGVIKLLSQQKQKTNVSSACDDGNLKDTLASDDKKSSKHRDTRQVLRLLGCLCCNNEAAVMEIVSRYPDTVNMVVDIMADVSRGENERREGVGVLAQLTSSNNHQDMLPIITSHISKIYNAIQSNNLKASSRMHFIMNYIV